MKIGQQPNLNALILLWAFAESGIGGVLHALKLPLTGLFVGGLSILCISLTAFWSGNQRKSILQALLTVIIVKLAVSPHSPWQAYVAVLFQGYFGYLLFRGQKGFAWRTMVFAVICMAESALQKMFMTWFIYGTSFFKALNQAANSVLTSFGLTAEGSFVLVLFSIYLLVYMVAGVILGWWIPRVPSQIEDFSRIFPHMNQMPSQASSVMKTKRNSVFLGFVLVFLFLLALKWLAPQIPSTQLLYIFFRSVFISLILIFIVGPLFLSYLRKWAGSKDANQVLVNSILDQIPLLTVTASGALHWVMRNYKGVQRIKFLVLALLVSTMRMTTKESDA